MILGALSDDHLIQLKVVTGTYYEPFRDFLHQILKVYAPKTKFEEITTIALL